MLHEVEEGRRHEKEIAMLRRSPLVLFAAFLLAGLPGWSQDGPLSKDWLQWGQNPQHTGTVEVAGQHARELLDDLVYDPFVAAEEADPLAFGQGLLAHYQVPLTDGDDVYMQFKTGVFTGLSTRNTQIWNERKLHWVDGHLAEVWNFESDWKPSPFFSLASLRGAYFEPPFQAVLVGNSVYVPGFGGSIFKVS